jgi:hypothetical protein
VYYSGDTSTSCFRDQKTIVPYRVIWETTAQAFVASGHPEEERGQHLHFESPVEYRIHAGRFVEYFRKMKDV